MGCGMSSCSNEVDVTEKTEQAPKLTKLVFTVAQDAETRATWGGTKNLTPMFEDGEFVSLFSENNDNVKLTAHVDGDNVTLEGEGNSGDTDLYFVYPWDEYATIEEGRITSEYREGPYSFNDGVIYPSDKYPSNALSFAKCNDGGESAIRFQGLMAIIKFTPAADCRGYIKVNAGASVILNDILAINPAGPSIEGYDGSVTATSMNFPDGEDFNFTADTPYYIALHPFTMSAGGTISFVDNGGNETTLYTAPAGGKEFVAGKIYNLKYVDAAQWTMNTLYDEWISTTNGRNMTSLYIRTGQSAPDGGDATVVYLNGECTLWSRYDDGTKTTYIETSKSVIEATSLCGTFRSFTKLTSISGLDKIDVSNVSDFSSCFMASAKITSLDLTSWNIKNGAYTSNMFSRMAGLEVLRINNTFPAGTGMFTNAGLSDTMGGPCQVYGASADLKNADDTTGREADRMVWAD